MRAWRRPLDRRRQIIGSREAGGAGETAGRADVVSRNSSAQRETFTAPWAPGDKGESALGLGARGAAGAAGAQHLEEAPRAESSRRGSSGCFSSSCHCGSAALAMRNCVGLAAAGWSPPSRW